MATIYKITNKKSGLYYIGKTIRPVQVRWKQHLRDFEIYKANKKTSIPLYNAFQLDGIENFTFEVIETNIPEKDINEKEKYYINFFDSKVHHKGYNVTDGGDGGRVWSKLTIKEVEQIYKILQDRNNLESLSSIAVKYNVAPRTIISINQGQSWIKEEYDYPLRKYDVTGLTITKDKYQKIVQDLKHSKLLKDIQKKYNLSEGQINAINQGKYCYNGLHEYYKDIYVGPFPIKQDKRTYTEESKFISIFYDVLFTKDSMAKIGQKYNIKGNTLQYIVNGKRRQELTKDFILPLRKNVITNQQIFLKLHPQFKGGG